MSSTIEVNLLKQQLDKRMKFVKQDIETISADIRAIRSQCLNMQGKKKEEEAQVNENTGKI